MSKSRREVDITWNYCDSVLPNRLQVKCKFCSHTCWGAIIRMKQHLAGTKKDVIPCCSVPDDVKEIFVKMLKGKEKKTEDGNFDCGGDLSKEVTKGKNDLQQMTINASYKNREDVIREICNYIYGNALPFDLVRSPLFIQMLKVVGDYGKGLKAPTYHEVRVSYLEKAMDNVQQCLEKYKTDWEKWGCTWMCDGWIDDKGRSLTNFLVNGPSGTVF